MGGFRKKSSLQLVLSRFTFLQYTVDMRIHKTDMIVLVTYHMLRVK